MKYAIRWLAAVLMCFMVLPLLVACGQTGNGETESTTQSETIPTKAPNGLYFLNEDGEFRFTILRSDYAQSDISSASLLVAKTFRTALGLTALTPQTDFVKRGDPIPDNEYEILIGDTNRTLSSELKQGLEKDEYLIQEKNNCIVIVAESNRALLLGVEKFVELLNEWCPDGVNKQLYCPKQLSIKGKYEIQHVLNEVTSLVPTAKYRATSFFMTNLPMNDSDRLSLATLQGLACNVGSEQIFVMIGGYQQFLVDLKAQGVKMEDKNSDGQVWTFDTLLAYYAERLDGYVLCENNLDSESARVAVCISGLLNAVVVTEENEGAAKKNGLQKKEDTRGKDDAWLRASEYFGQLRRDLAFEQAVNMSPRVIDYAVMTKSYVNFYNGHSQEEHQAMYDFLNPGAVVMGWNNTLGEFDTVSSLAQLSLQLLPADHAFNLSTYSGFAEKKLKQPNSYQGDGTVANKHTVVFIMSDGDNMQFFINDYAKESWFNSSARGQFEMTWGVPPSSIDMAAPVLKYYFDFATPKDQFIAQVSGMGYTYPSKWTNTDARFDMTAKVSEEMDRMGLKYLLICDDRNFDTTVLEDYLLQDSIHGAFIIDFLNYAQYRGEIKWIKDKPAVSARYRLWAGLPDGDIDYIANQINNASRDPSKADSYSFVVVHAWSGLDKDGNFVAMGDCMASVNKLVGKFSNNVEVVSVDEFMTRLNKNVQH